ncbi:MAG: asparagine--tRNA ligase [bacterium]
MNTQFYLSGLKTKLPEEIVTLKGWVFNARSSGSIGFLQFRDGTGYIQIIAEKSKLKENIWEEVKTLTAESSVIVTGTIREEKRSPFGFEMDLESIEVIQKADVDYPIQKKEHGPEFLLDNRHLWLRSNQQIALMRIRHNVEYAIYDYFEKNEFIRIDSPIFTPNPCEGSGTLFKVPYTPSWPDEVIEGEQNLRLTETGIETEKGVKLPTAFLSQSGQLYIEAAIFGHAKVYDFGPTFRAEKSKTRRHLTEFWMMDAEMAYHNHDDNLRVQEGLMKHIIKRCLYNCEAELKLLERDTTILSNILTKPFARITHEEAVKMLQKDGIKIGDRDDLGADEEAVLTKKFDVPIFVEKYPREIKAFYMKQDPSDKSRVLNADLLAPEGVGEIIGGSEREDDYEKLKARMLEEKLNLDEYKWYLDLRKYGSVPHSGFGVGLERTVRWISGREHIRECIPFPRMINRITP